MDEKPKVFITLTDSWVDCTVRYLVPARARRRWSSDLAVALSDFSSRKKEALEKNYLQGRFVAPKPSSARPYDRVR